MPNCQGVKVASKSARVGLLLSNRTNFQMVSDIGSDFVPP